MDYEERYYVSKNRRSVCKFPNQGELFEVCKDMIKDFQHCNLEILIDEVIFNCHLLILQCYSNFFQKYETNTKRIVLGRKNVSVSTLVRIYDWILTPAPAVRRDHIIDLYMAAQYLEIDELEMHCWTYMDDEERFTEETAFYLYKEAREMNHSLIKNLMVQRICKFFLTLVSSLDFLELEYDEVCELLTMSTIGVNSEIEILFAGFRWVNHDWQRRNKFIYDIISCVRFTLMSPMQLVQLSMAALSNTPLRRSDRKAMSKLMATNNSTKKANIRTITKIIQMPAVQDLIRNASIYVTTVCWQNRSGLVSDNRSLMRKIGLIPPIPRVWLHHNGVQVCNCHDIIFISYESYLDYLVMLRNAPTDYYKSIKVTTTDPIHCNCVKNKLKKK